MINNRSEYRLYKLKRLVHDGIIEGLDVQNKSNIIPIMHVSNDIQNLKQTDIDNFKIRKKFRLSIQKQ